ncbi:MAG: SPFH domain-containing protein [bacterium]|nr:SPFH domain-containing protein [bacterium]
MYWILGIVLAILLLSGLYTVKQQTVAIIERFGKFKKASSAGLNIKIPLIDRIAGRVSFRIQQLDVQVDLTEQMRNAMITAQEVTKHSAKHGHTPAV